MGESPKSLSPSEPSAICCDTLPDTLYCNFGTGFPCMEGESVEMPLASTSPTAWTWTSVDPGPYGTCESTIGISFTLEVQEVGCYGTITWTGCVSGSFGDAAPADCDPFMWAYVVSPISGTCANDGYLYFSLTGAPARRRTKLAVPPLPRRFTNWREAIHRWKAAGKPTRTPDEVERINREHCRPCDHYDAKWQQCKLCGCFCRSRGRAEFNKPAMLTERCPLEPPKWGGIYGCLPATFRAPMDVVYPISGGKHGRKKLGSKWDNNELRYSLRSLERYFPNMARVFIVGHKPDWLTNVIHLPAEDRHRKNKDANIIDKVLLACRSGVSPTFLRLSDDQCLLQPWDGLVAYHFGHAPDRGGGKWWRRMRRTCEYLRSRGRPTWFYDTHAPAPVDRETFLRVATEADYQTPPGLCINTLYFNSIEIPREHIGSRKAAFHRPTALRWLREKAVGKVFLGYSEGGTNDAMKQFLQEQFPTPSRFEK